MILCGSQSTNSRVRNARKTEARTAHQRQALNKTNARKEPRLQRQQIAERGSDSTSTAPRNEHGHREHTQSAQQQRTAQRAQQREQALAAHRAMAVTSSGHLLLVSNCITTAQKAQQSKIPRSEPQKPRQSRIRRFCAGDTSEQQQQTATRITNRATRNERCSGSKQKVQQQQPGTIKAGPNQTNQSQMDRPSTASRACAGSPAEMDCSATGSGGNAEAYQNAAPTRNKTRQTTHGSNVS